MHVELPQWKLAGDFQHLGVRLLPWKLRHYQALCLGKKATTRAKSYLERVGGVLERLLHLPRAKLAQVPPRRALLQWLSAAASSANSAAPPRPAAAGTPGSWPGPPPCCASPGAPSTRTAAARPWAPHAHRHVCTVLFAQRSIPSAPASGYELSGLSPYIGHIGTVTGLF